MADYILGTGYSSFSELRVNHYITWSEGIKYKPDELRFLASVTGMTQFEEEPLDCGLQVIKKDKRHNPAKDTIEEYVELGCVMDCGQHLITELTEEEHDMACDRLGYPLFQQISFSGLASLVDLANGIREGLNKPLYCFEDDEQYIFSLIEKGNLPRTDYEAALKRKNNG